ncbi:hypothetical protein [Rhizobium sp. BK602]|uniref:hypothetical protein n=1 Tax=Rhizobium sp. BK602 TaxID=2586986 RepID=UPI001621B7AC|nr:hypothetical protein [Rhizobium sp. BK602]MBB3612397.1 hypothetical protein [Rhizobium sp. BK602]
MRNIDTDTARADRWTMRESVFAILSLVWVLLLHGAVPFLMMPTLGQAVWATGFAQSFANGSLLDLHAHDFGLPIPSAIAFGLSGALPASWLIRLGLHPADAYAGMAAFWLTLAFCSAYLIARLRGATRSVSILCAVTWTSMPVIWAHAGYSMLSLGIALLPFYFLAAFRLFRFDAAAGPISATMLYPLVAFISVFMDGYTFVMFAAGSSLLLGYCLVTDAGKRSDLLTRALPVHIVSFALAYLAFATYIGRYSYEQNSIDFFRGWGLDLSFVVIPTKGMHWLLDMIGASKSRTNATYFGDYSVWKTTFALPIITAALLAWWQTRQGRGLATCFMAIALIAFYMALGPSLKIDAVKPPELQLAHPREQSATMPAEFALGPTGSAWISETLPGFKSMRSAYRWSALGIFALWMVVVVWSGSREKHHGLPVVALALVTLLNVPALPERFRSLLDNRMQFLQIDQDLVAPLRTSISRDETVAFAPWRNDFIVNYLAPKLGFRSFNIGGDKNLADAMANWPTDMRTLDEPLDQGKSSHIVQLLANRTVDAVVVPYFDTLWSAHLWPCVSQTQAMLSEGAREDWSNYPGFYCPDQHKTALGSVIRKMEEIPYLAVEDGDLFAVIRLRPEYRGEAGHKLLQDAVFARIQFPIVFGSAMQDSAFILPLGWNTLEENHVWSQSDAKLVLPVPRACDTKQCLALLHFDVFGASPQRPVEIEFASRIGNDGWTKTAVVTTADGNEVPVPLDGRVTHQEITVKIPSATSPQALLGSPDGRILGIGLLRADLTFAGQ